MMQRYLLPRVLTDRLGQSRKAGFEFEFGNLPVLLTAGALREAMGGHTRRQKSFRSDAARFKYR